MAVKRILVTDDDATSRLVIRRCLESSDAADFEVIEAANGVECLMAVERRGPVDLILLDVDMPEMDGYTVCEAIRRVDSAVPIVFVTGHADVEHRVSGRRAGGDSYLVKPVKHAALMSVVRLFVNADRRRPRRS